MPVCAEIYCAPLNRLAQQARAALNGKCTLQCVDAVFEAHLLARYADKTAVTTAPHCRVVNQKRAQPDYYCGDQRYVPAGRPWLHCLALTVDEMENTADG